MSDKETVATANQKLVEARDEAQKVIYKGSSPAELARAEKEKNGNYKVMEANNRAATEFMGRIDRNRQEELAQDSKNGPARVALAAEYIRTQTKLVELGMKPEVAKEALDDVVSRPAGLGFRPDLEDKVREAKDMLKEKEKNGKPVSYGGVNIQDALASAKAMPLAKPFVEPEVPAAIGTGGRPRTLT
jgi:hypothetical protein